MLRRIKPYVLKDTMTLLYLCLIQSQIDYCCEIWGAHAINQTVSKSTVAPDFPSSGYLM